MGMSRSPQNGGSQKWRGGTPLPCNRVQTRPRLGGNHDCRIISLGALLPCLRHGLIGTCPCSGCLSDRDHLQALSIAEKARIDRKSKFKSTTAICAPPTEVM